MSTATEVAAFTMSPKLKWDPDKNGFDVTHTEPELGTFVPELVAFHTDKDGDYVTGDDMPARTKHEHNGGLRALEAMEANQDKIPKEWADQDLVLLFPGDVLQRRDARDRLVGCLCFSRDARRWSHSFRWVDNRFGRLCRVVRLGKYQKVPGTPES